jgi:hypothetical protein
MKWCAGSGDDACGDRPGARLKRFFEFKSRPGVKTMQKITPFLWFKDPARASRVMQAMLKMVKLDFAGLQRAYDGA